MADERILIVDDSKSLNQYICAVLERGNYVCQGAFNGKEAFDMLPQFRPDLVVTDLEMPVETGLYLISRMKESDIFRSIPIVLLTGRADDATRQEVRNAGADNYLSKPFSDIELIAVIRNLLALKGREKMLLIELERAKRIQERLLPTTKPSTSQLLIEARYLPMEHVGGDIYDFVKFADGALGLFIADVTGHGVSAAMLGSMVKLSLAIVIENEVSPSVCLARLNRYLFGRLADSMVTAALLRWEPDKHVWRYSSAGHDPLIIVRNGEVEYCKPKGRAFGIIDVNIYEEATISFEIGDRLLLATDGINESANINGKQFADERLPHFVTTNRSLSLIPFIDGLINDARSYETNPNFQDDVTLIAAERIS